jgi:hypothetical protein
VEGQSTFFYLRNYYYTFHIILANTNICNKLGIFEGKLTKPYKNVANVI